MKEWITEYANQADDGAPYSGPTLLAESADAALSLLHVVKGPNGETLTLLGELVQPESANRIRDTFTTYKRSDD